MVPPSFPPLAPKAITPISIFKGNPILAINTDRMPASRYKND